MAKRLRPEETKKTYVEKTLSDLMIPNDSLSEARGKNYKLYVQDNFNMLQHVTFEFTGARTPQIKVFQEGKEPQTITIGICHQDQWKYDLAKLLLIPVKGPSSFEYCGSIEMNEDGSIAQKSLDTLIADIEKDYREQFLVD